MSASDTVLTKSDSIYMVRPLRFVAHERLTKHARKYFLPTLLSGCEISLGTRLGARCVYNCETTALHVACCSSVDELYRCALSTGSTKGEQLSKPLLLRQGDRLRRAREEAGTLEQVSCVLSARILDLHTTLTRLNTATLACSRSSSMPCIHLVRHTRSIFTRSTPIWPTLRKSTFHKINSQDINFNKIKSTHKTIINNSQKTQSQMLQSSKVLDCP